MKCGTSQGPGGHKCGPSEIQQVKECSTQSRDMLGLHETSQGPGVQKCGPTPPQTFDELCVLQASESEESASTEVDAHECRRGELAGVGGRCTGNRSSPEQTLEPAAELETDDEVELEVAKNENTKRPRISEAEASRQRECEHFYIGDEEVIHTHYRVHGKSEPGWLLKRKR